MHSKFSGEFTFSFSGQLYREEEHEQ